MEKVYVLHGVVNRLAMQKYIIGCFSTREAALRAEKTIRARQTQCEPDYVIQPWDSFVVEEYGINKVRNDFNPEAPCGEWLDIGPIGSVSIGVGGIGGIGGSVGMAGDNGAGSLRSNHE